jgi:putative long chain acyl-CoA synthase
MGHPLPGSAEVRIAGYDIDERRLVVDAAGFARRVPTNEVGMLLVRVSPNDPLTAAPLRGVFTPDDAWALTGDLFRCDDDGDYWRVDGLAEVIRTKHGPVFSTPIREALGDLGPVDLAVAYGVRGGGEHELAVAAVTLRDGQELTGRQLSRGLQALDPGQRPAVVRVVERIPLTTWYRPITGPLRQEGIVEGAIGWYRDAGGETYRPLSAAARRRLVGRAATGITD